MKQNRKFPYGLVLAVILAVTSFLLYLQNNTFRTQLQRRNLLLAQQSAVIDSIKRGGLNTLMSTMLNKIDDEVKQSPNRMLSDERIAGLAALCYLLKPYASLEGDSLSKRKLSPERGQILLMLCRMKMDSSSFKKIKAQASFAGADLQDADLHEVDLSDADLSGANLQNANLEGANLGGTNLKFANLWGANLNKANLKMVNAKRADMRWAEINEGDLTNADLHEADLTAAKLRKAYLRGANLQWVDFNGAMLNEANLDSADMFRAGLKRAQLNGAILSNANLNLANLVEANLTNANLTNANMLDVVVSEKNWLRSLTDWPVIGAKEIQEQYKIVDELSTGVHLYWLKKIKN